MKNHYLLWATGRDRSGIVAAVTEALFKNGCNLEDSSMMRLGSEFAILVIFTSTRPLSTTLRRKMFASLEKKWRLDVGLKEISRSEAAFTAPTSGLHVVAVHGPDRPGIVYRVATTLARHKFNITDLATHRTTAGKGPGYILLIEGELKGPARRAAVARELARLAPKLRTTITFRPVPTQSL